MVKVRCKICKGTTNHDILYQHKTNWDTDDFWGADTYQVVKCLGCEDISFTHIHNFSEDVEPDGAVSDQISIYPARGEKILTAEDFFGLSHPLRTLYLEVINCFNNQCLTLCAIGIRAIIEGICQNEGIKCGTVIDSKGTPRVSKQLDGKIAGLQQSGMLTSKQANFLHELRFMGNEAAHELSRPTDEELEIAIDILEYTIVNLYEMDGKIENLKYLSRKRKKIK